MFVDFLAESCHISFLLKRERCSGGLIVDILHFEMLYETFKPKSYNYHVKILGRERKKQYEGKSSTDREEEASPHLNLF